MYGNSCGRLLPERLGLHLASHDLDKLRGELHVRLEGEITARRALKHESKI